MFNFLVVFDFYVVILGTVLHTYNSRLYESNILGMEEDTQKKKSKIEGVNRVGDEYKKF